MKRMIYIVLLVCTSISITACGKKQDINTGSIVVEETLATEDNKENHTDSNESGQYIFDEKERINDNKPITDESSNYAEIEKLMNKIAEETGGTD